MQSTDKPGKSTDRFTREISLLLSAAPCDQEHSLRGINKTNRNAHGERDFLAKFS